MDNKKQIKARLRSVVHLEGISNKEIAEKTGYNELQVSKSLNQKHDVLTEKFLTSFFDAFPTIRDKYKEQILQGENEDSLFNNSTQITILKNENNQLKLQIQELREDVIFFKAMLKQAMRIHPDLEAKLPNPYAFDKLGADNYTSSIVFSSHKGLNKGLMVH